MNQENEKIALELIDVERSFGKQQVLKKVNLVVREGTTTVIVGPSGQGKSVILKHMLGLLKPDKGQVLVYGRDLSRMNKRQLKEVRKDFGVLFQNVALFDSMNVFDNVALPLRERTDAGEAEIRENVEEKLALMDLAEMGDKYPAQLSGGMKKRVGLARALVMKPRIVFFDEPTTGLDGEESREIIELIKRLQGDGHTIIMVTHSREIAEECADRVVRMEAGKIVSDSGAGA